MRTKLSLKYFLFLYILAISGFEYFHRVSQPATYLLFPLASLIFVYYKEKFNFSVLKIILPFFGVFTLQNIFYGTPFYFSLTLVIRLLTFYFVVKIIGDDFIKIFINTVRFISLISIIFYGIQYIPWIYDVLLELCEHFTNLGSNPDVVIDRPNFIIYTIQKREVEDVFFRISGPFWEPGLFAVFLNIALFLNIFVKKSLLNKTNVLFIISLIFTFSTTGIITLLMIITIFSFTMKSQSLLYRIILILFLIFSIPAISSLPYMSEKIIEQFNQSDISYSRFGAAVVHWNIIKDYPYTGLPYDDVTYSKYADNISPNGFTEIFVRYGVIVGLFYYILLFRSSNAIMNSLCFVNKGWFLFLILILLIFSQTIGNKPIYWTLIFLSMALASNFSGEENLEV